MIRAAAIASALYLAVAHAQQVGTLEAEVHPSLPSQQCTASGCTTVATKIVLDSNWRWVHTTSGFTNCYDGNSWNTSLCPNGSTCASQCALEGANYSGTYGITASGNSLSLKFVTGSNIGSRVYLLRDDTHYQMFNLLNGEFTFDVDMSTLGCGLNGALYLSQMDEDGGLARFPSNKAGAKYGTGYCDAQCPHDIKFINGQANVEGWNPSETDPNAGSGRYGTCCDEMDIWEANSQATAYTPHPCSPDGQYRCDGLECGDGADRYNSVCDKDGCDFNSWRMGNRDFLGPGKTIDTRRKFTVVTQFITSDGTANGDLTEIRRKYVQDGVVYENSQSNFSGITPTNSITDAFCAQQKTLFGDNNKFATEGGLKAMGASLKKGMVLSLSIWADHAAHMLWLDSDYPLDKDPSAPGISRGPCATTSGDPDDVVDQQGNATVSFSNIKWGTLGSTFSGSTGSTSTRTGATSSTRVSSSSTRTSSSSSPATSTVPQWGQCGGINYTGSTVCAAPYTCHKLNDFYSQCY